MFLVVKNLVLKLSQYIYLYSLYAGILIRPITAMEVAKVETEQKEEQIVPNKKSTRYKRRFMKRQWEDVNPKKKENGESDEKKLCDKPVERIKRKKVAMLLGYCGVDYYGMQR